MFIICNYARCGSRPFRETSRYPTWLGKIEVGAYFALAASLIAIGFLLSLRVAPFTSLSPLIGRAFLIVGGLGVLFTATLIIGDTLVSCCLRYYPKSNNQQQSRPICHSMEFGASDLKDADLEKRIRFSMISHLIKSTQDASEVGEAKNFLQELHTALQDCATKPDGQEDTARALLENLVRAEKKFFSKGHTDFYLATLLITLHYALTIEHTHPDQERLLIAQVQKKLEKIVVPSRSFQYNTLFLSSDSLFDSYHLMILYDALGYLSDDLKVATETVHKQLTGFFM